MGCSVEIPNQAEVLQVQITDFNGRVETQSLRAGRDTAEWAYDCADVKPVIQHQQASIFQSVPQQRAEAGGCPGHTYRSTLKLDQPATIKSLDLKWIGPSAVLSIPQISLIDQTTQTSAAFTARGLSPDLRNTSRWQYVENFGETAVYENLQAMPRAWLVSEGIHFKRKAELLKVIQSSQLPDGRLFEPENMALLERAKAFRYAPLQPTDLVKIDNISDTRVDVQTETASKAFLVLSDVYYPGWEATIDGKSTRIFRANYLQRGVKLPKGKHTVKFEFRPKSFSLGVGISTASLFVCGFLLLPKNLFQKIRLTRTMRSQNINDTIHTSRI